ncbi:MAG TPA: hypothetical protein VEI02_01870, partial [Planctomycetota bacterium]|nr:hypothetical protein [Planctomycetota bacterium]
MSRTLKGLGGPAPVSPRLSPLGTPARGAVRASEICDLAWAVGQKIVSLRDVPHASLAVVFDVVSGVLLGRAFAREPSSAASEAWRDAVSRRRPPHVCLFHDFVGEPFTDRAFR